MARPLISVDHRLQGQQELRSLVIVLGDQLDLEAAAFDDFDSGRNRVWMAEVVQESTHVWSSKPRIAIFLAAMRHFAAALRDDDRAAGTAPIRTRRRAGPRA